MRDRAIERHDDISTETIRLRDEEPVIERRVSEMNSPAVEIGVVSEPAVVEIDLLHDELVVERRPLDGARVEHAMVSEPDLVIRLARDRPATTIFTEVTGSIDLGRIRREATASVEIDLRREVIVTHGGATSDVESRAQ